MSNSNLNKIEINHIGVFIDAIEKLVITEKRSLDKIAEVLKVDISSLQKELAIHLFKKGYSVDRISKELNVEKEVVQREIDTEGLRVNDQTVLNRYWYSKEPMDLIRCSYYKKYFALGEQYSQYRSIRLVDAPNKVVKTINKIEGDVATFLSEECTSKEKIADRVNRDIGGLNNNRLTIDDCWSILSSISKLRKNGYNSKALDANEQRIIKLMNIEIVRVVNQSISLEDLEDIYQKVSRVRDNYQLASDKEDSKDFQKLANIIGTKLETLRNINKKSEFIHHIPPEMHNAICGLLDESLGIDEIRAIIHYKDPQNNETENLIRVLSERSDIYPINPQMYLYLMARFNALVDRDEAKVSSFRRMIMENLCQRRKFKEAREIIEEKIKIEDGIADDKRNGVIDDLQAFVLYKEIGYLVLKQIAEKKSNTEDQEFVETLKKRLNQKGDAKAIMEKISLGKDQFGIETIYLNQIMEIEPKKNIPKEKERKLDSSSRNLSKKGEPAKTSSVPSNKQDGSGIPKSTTPQMNSIGAKPPATSKAKAKIRVKLEEREVQNPTASGMSSVGQSKKAVINQPYSGRNTEDGDAPRRNKIISGHKNQSSTVERATVISNSKRIQETLARPSKSSPKKGKKISEMEMLRSAFFRRYESFGVDDSIFKVVKYDEDPLKVAETINSINQLFERI